ncbi:MAG: hypothetical protein ACM3XN_11315 [Chloroflexota bacterium]
MSDNVDGITEAQFRYRLPSALVDAATDYVVAGRVTSLTKLGGRLAGRIRGHNGSYRAAVEIAGAPAYACDCGREQPCRHAVAVALAWFRESEAFLDLEPLIAGVSDDAARSALRHVVERCFGPATGDSGDALRELFAGAGDADPLRLASFLEALGGLHLTERQRVPDRVAELRERAAALARRQGRTTAARALVALIDAVGRMLARPGWRNDAGLLAQAIAAVADLDRLLAPGGLNGEALSDSLRSLGDLLPLLPEDLLLPVLSAGARISRSAPAYLGHRLRAAVESGKADLAVAPADPRALMRVRGLAQSLVRFLLSQGADEAALALARGEADGPAGPLPLIEALAGCGRHDEAIAVAQDALRRATGGDIALLRRRLAELFRLSGRRQQALAYLAADFHDVPGSENYAELRQLATECGNWDELRGGALARLRAVAEPAVYCQAVVSEARALADSAPGAASELLSEALLTVPATGSGELAGDWRPGVELMFREARRLFRRAQDEPGWRRLRDECRRRYGIQ